MTHQQQQQQQQHPSPHQPPTTPLAAIPGVVAAARAAFESGRTRTVAWRKAQLRALYAWIVDNEDDILDAVSADLRRARNDSYQFEILPVLNEIALMLDHVDEWAAPQRVPNVVFTPLSRPEVRREPFGVAAILAPWNFPFQLVVLPLAQAICAGNAVIVKPSEISPRTESLLYTKLTARLDQQAIHVIAGDAAQAEALLALPLDHITYTGNNTIGRRVMAAAARNLTPVLLEMGGKCPVYVHRDAANLVVAAKRLLWAKTANAGQLCLAPDYVLVHRDARRRFCAALVDAWWRYFGGEGGARGEPWYGRIVNARHFERVERVLERQKACAAARRSARTNAATVAAAAAATDDDGDDNHYGGLLFGGEVDAGERYVAPTAFVGVRLTDPVMEEELFAPVLAIIEVADEDEAIAIINLRARPLSLTVFTATPSTAEKLLPRTSSGIAMVNDVLMHGLNPHLPLGGVGASGIGSYHGRAGFDAYTHPRATLWSPSGWDVLNAPRYPHDIESPVVGWLQRRVLTNRPREWLARAVVGAATGAVGAVVVVAAVAVAAFWAGAVWAGRGAATMLL